MFESARLKVERANEHIRDFDEAFQAFLDRHPYGIFCQGRHGVSYHFGMTEPIPDEIMIVAGDAIHNLHTALDHCIWALWSHDVPANERASRWADRVKLPSSITNRTDYESSINGMVNACGGREDAVRLLKKLAVHPEGGIVGRALLALHKLDITDKQCVLVPVVPSAEITGLSEVTTTHEGAIIINKLPTAKVALTPDFAWSSTERNHFFGGLFVGAYDYSPFTPKLQFDDDHKITLEILFADNQPFPGEAILPTLSQLSDLVIEVIGWFEDLVRARAG